MVDFSSLDPLDPLVSLGQYSEAGGYISGALISGQSTSSAETLPRAQFDSSAPANSDPRAADFTSGVALDDPLLYDDGPSDEVDAGTLHKFVDDVKKWLRQWVEQGSNPYIHRHLYHDHLPREIQDVYTCCAAYFAKTPTNSGMVLRIVEDRVTAMLEGQPDSPTPLSLFQHLARVHALFTYQVIRLFDGNIRQRALAEQHATILNTWVQEMWECFHLSGLDVYHGRSSNTPERLRRQQQQQMMDSPSVSPIWTAWYMTESVRRTWITVRVTQSVYNTMKGGISVCPGWTALTVDRDVWAAPSAYRWAQACKSHNRHIAQSGELQSLILHARASDVDDFVKVMMFFLHRRETVERWIDET
ncbi:hypothetical protein AJ80_08555 [Polytolypa hystricis UAMH7299]|uniref:Transcription factor domain-containing protein n=1 Tax=Polytolypa hystricis (strain UAMH7299) TaxID=1447883 RepID=A0A2B7X5S4_POLH7|nr:hypothetical protein AJ80_08555 [Polytolypa hystricis UAMH7299]